MDYIVPTWMKLLVVLFILGATYTAGYKTRGIAAERDTLAVETKHKQALLEQDHVVAKYKEALQSIANKVEVKLNENIQLHKAELAKYKRDVAAAGGLRDPGIRTTCDSATAGSTPVTAPTPSGARLSDEATAFLLGEANTADQVVSQYLACQQYLFGITGVKP